MRPLTHNKLLRSSFHYTDCTGSLVIAGVMWKREELLGTSSGYSNNNSKIKEGQITLNVAITEIQGNA